MRKQTLYYAEGSSHPFYSEEEAKAEELKNELIMKRMIENSSHSKLNKLLLDLNNANYIHPSTIATCTWDSLAIKAMVKVCQKFTDENKDYLNYY